MKKLLLFAFICLSTSIYAQNIKLVSGELDFLKSEQYVDIKFTYDNLRVGKLTEEQYVAKITVLKSSANDFLGTDFDTAYRIGECYAKGGRELGAFIVKKLKK